MSASLVCILSLDTFLTVFTRFDKKIAEEHSRSSSIIVKLISIFSTVLSDGGSLEEQKNIESGSAEQKPRSAS